MDRIAYLSALKPLAVMLCFGLCSCAAVSAVGTAASVAGDVALGSARVAAGAVRTTASVAVDGVQAAVR